MGNFKIKKRSHDCFFYYIPLSSPKNSDYQIINGERKIRKSIVPIIRMTHKNTNGVLELKGTLKLNNMIPVPKSELTLYDAENEPVMPYADLMVTNLSIAGGISSRTITVEKSLRVTGNSHVSAPLSLKSGGTFTLVRNGAGGFFEVEADTFSIEPKGRIAISDWDGILCGQSYRVVETESLSGNASGWSGRNADGSVKARFEIRSDGLYLKFESGGTRIIIR